jgi:hypothetical protein
MKRLSKCAAGAIGIIALSGSLLSQEKPVVTPEVSHALQLISPADLKGDLSFLSSDALQGRWTPSPGLDIAAEFIASQFRAAGLQAAGDQDYFQIANMVDRQMPPVKSEMTLREGAQSTTVPGQNITVNDANDAATIDRAPVTVLKAKDPALLNGLDLKGKALVVPGPTPTQRRDMDAYIRMREFDQEVAKSGAAVELTVMQTRAGGQAGARLIEAADAHGERTPSITVSSDELQKWIDHAGQAAEARTLSLDIPAPEDKNVVVKNVIGVLRGSDSTLKNTYVMLTAHYDHIGATETAGRLAVNQKAAGNDHIYNGANDDGSGTVSVIEIAKALGSLTPHPKRSMVFMTFFGEERGLLGSQFYGRHPRFPVTQTVADLNLEQVGRTDSREGPQIDNASLTGFDYSDLTKYLEAAGKAMGVKVYMNKEASDPFFMRSDNAALAALGVPAETLCVAFDYPDYHGLGDEWPKIDYNNMAHVDRMVALGLLDIANSTAPPQWNAANPKTQPYREAQQKSRHAEGGHSGTN